ncbi:MAG: PD40 domain-containing protein [Verrucomicrobia bacterium]|nr:PD40 domain-containing protein [Verrucomicrobiota bacterium]
MIPLRGFSNTLVASAQAVAEGAGQATVSLSLGGARDQHAVLSEGVASLNLSAPAGSTNLALRLTATALKAGAAVRWRNVRLACGDRQIDVSLWPGSGDVEACPARVLPPMRKPIQEALIEWDWRMQDGIGTEREPRSYAAALERLLPRGEALLHDLSAAGVELADLPARWRSLQQQQQRLVGAAADEAQPLAISTRTSPAGEGRSGGASVLASRGARQADGSRVRSPHQPASNSVMIAADEARWEELWRAAHRLRREIVFANPLARTGPLGFIKQAPGIFSHQLTQYYGSCARPGGGVFVLTEPGRSMTCRELAGSGLPLGSFQHLDAAWDGSRLLFASCRAATTPRNREECLDRFYHLFEVKPDGTGLRQLTDGPADDFAPRHLPNGKIVFVSTRRGGFHRCGRGPCAVYTLTEADADGAHPRTISFHETHEWDPAVLHDGRLIYTRWDYVDRHAVYYQQLWTVRPGGSDVRAFYGNNTFNPVGIWEAQAVPGSDRVMATAGAHHAMTAGSIILLDTTRGMDGPEPITRLTPDALFPESEAPVVLQPNGAWHAPAGVSRPPTVPAEAARWPGHCYRSPWPLSEKFFLVAYSFDALIGEPTWNRANMFGLYLADAFGNKELLFRDLNLSSLWAVPLRARTPPVRLAADAEEELKGEGTFFMENVNASWPALPREPITRLRIVQVLPKSTPHANEPTVGLPSASPGKQVLGTVPVEADGSAFFRAPAGIPLAFQALDARGQAVQIMRSLTCLQPGERASCLGCHEPRDSAPSAGRSAMALRRPPSPITPGPDGSNPLSYPLLVQPVLDRKCVSCHNAAKPEGKVLLTGEAQGRYTVSYNVLAPLVPWSAWGGKPGDFRQVNAEPVTPPDFFGARGCKLMKHLLAGHYDVKLDAEDVERLATWMDANALFYGTFDPHDQARQQLGQRIAGPKVQ